MTFVFYNKKRILIGFINFIIRQHCFLFYAFVSFVSRNVHSALLQCIFEEIFFSRNGVVDVWSHLALWKRMVLSITMLPKLNTAGKDYPVVFVATNSSWWRIQTHPAKGFTYKAYFLPTGKVTQMVHFRSLKFVLELPHSSVHGNFSSGM